jgi:glycerophosphoryl diester phosphodiesterase
MSPLPPAFLGPAIAHRALHDKADGRPENSRAAIRAAIAKGYGIEIDLQLSADGAAMVFHDYRLNRLTGAKGAVKEHSAADLGRIPLLHGDGEGIPRFAEVLDLVAGRVPLLVEIKDQDGLMGPNVGTLEEAAARDLAGYGGPVAVMSFNPHTVAAFAAQAPEIPRGLTTCSYRSADWPMLPEATCAYLRAIPDYGRVGACFISHRADDLASPQVARIREQGGNILCWTIRSAAEEAHAREFADNVTFEGYLAA